MSYFNPWVHGHEFYFDHEPAYVGFVYLITNRINDRKYIGKKGFTSTKTKQVKGKKKRFQVESDWKEYYGSNDELNKDVAEHGEENFSREILRLCKTKGEVSYFEAKYQFETDCVLRADYYNHWISVRVRKSHFRHLLIT